MVNSLFLGFWVRFVVFWNGVSIFAHVGTEDGSAVSYIGDVAHLVDDKNDDGTATTSFDWILILSIC